MASNRVSAYLDYLPALCQQDPVLGQFLLAFERLLIGTGQWDDDDVLPGVEGLETLIDRIPSTFEPLGARGYTPSHMLSWLASWMGVSPSEDLPDTTRRRLIQQAIRLYQQRGTPAGLATLMEIYLGRKVTIQDQSPDFPPFYFEVTLHLDHSDPRLLAEVDRVARTILDGEKPAHTCYGLKLLVPGMQIVNEPQARGQGLVMGETTMLGTT